MKLKAPRKRRQRKEKPTKHLEPDVIAEMHPSQHGYRDAAEILSGKLRAMFVNLLRISAPPLTTDIETLMVYMMDACPTHLADLMTNEFTQGYLAGFVMSMVDYKQAEIEWQLEQEQRDEHG